MKKTINNRLVDKLFSSYRTVFELAVFELAQALQDSKLSDLNYSYEALVQKEALTIYQDRVFASFLCVLSLSSVLGKFIQRYYPDNGMYKYKILFKQLVAPRTEPFPGKLIIILWSNLAGSLAQKMDHFVTLISRKSNKGMNQLLFKVLRNEK